MGSTSTSWEFLEGLALGVAISGAVFVATWFAIARMRRPRPSRVLPDAPARVPGTTPPRGDSLSTNSRGVGVPCPTDAPASAVAEPEALPPVPPATIRLSQRVLIHLLQHDGIGAEGKHGDGLTQRGISVRLDAAQGALSSVLRRLEDGGAVASERAHVHGRSKRVKIYRLTARGRELAGAHAEAVANDLGASVGPSPIDPAPPSSRAGPDPAIARPAGALRR